MALEPDDPINAGVTMVIPAFQSPNYVAGVSGWAVFIDGSCEFNNGVFRGTITASEFHGSDFIINQSGAFFYSGTPAAGNLIISVASAAGTDTFGNTYPEGIQINGAGANILTLNPLVGPELVLNPDTTKYVSGWGRLIAQDNGTFASAILESPINSSGSPGLARLTVSGQTSGGGAGAFFLFETTGTPNGLAKFSVPVISTGETWHTPSYSAGWGGSTTFNGVGGPTLRYRIDAEDNLWLYGMFATTSTTAVNPVFTLPAAWRPAASGEVFGQRNNGGTLTSGSMFISTSGNFDLFAGLGIGIPAVSGVEFFVNGKVPLGNIT